MCFSFSSKEVYQSELWFFRTARKKLNEVFLYGDRKRLPVILLVDEVSGKFANR